MKGFNFLCLYLYVLNENKLFVRLTKENEVQIT